MLNLNGFDDQKDECRCHSYLEHCIINIIANLETTNAHWDDVKNEVDAEYADLNSLCLHPLRINKFLNWFLLEEFVIYLVFSLLSYDARVIQIIKFLLWFLLNVGTNLFTNNLHVEIDIEVFNFEFLIKTFRFLLILHYYVLSDFIFNVQEILETVNSLVLLFIVRERR